MGRIILDTNQFMPNTHNDLGRHHRVTTKAGLRLCLFLCLSIPVPHVAPSLRERVNTRWIKRTGQQRC